VIALIAAGLALWTRRTFIENNALDVKNLDA